MKNVTISISERLHGEARKLAAEQGTSLSRMVAEILEDLVSRKERELAAQKNLMMLFEKGPKYGGKPAAREELYGD